MGRIFSSFKPSLKCVTVNYLKNSAKKFMREKPLDKIISEMKLQSMHCEVSDESDNNVDYEED